jgi:hypothetical protein
MVKMHSKPLDRWLGVLGIVVGIVYWLVPKNSVTIVLTLMLMFGLLVHPICNFWWIEKRLFRRVWACIVAVAFLVCLGFLAWPSKPLVAPLSQDGKSVMLEKQKKIPLEQDSGPAKPTPAPQMNDQLPRKQASPKPRPETQTPANPPINSSNNEKAAATAINIAPGGFAISGGTVNQPTINTFSDRYPKPGVVPTVTFCVTQHEDATKHQTIITIKTDAEISEPYWWFGFDGPVLEDGTVEIVDAKEPYGTTHGRPPGDRPLPMPRDQIFGAQIALIGNPFGAVRRPLGPTDTVRVTVSSLRPVKIVHIESGSGRAHLDENIVLGCK